MARLIPILLVLLASLFSPAPAAHAATSAAPNPQTAPCVTAAMEALQQRGKPYIWGAKGPNAFDCSGLTWWAYQQAGVDIGHGTSAQMRAGVAINCTLAQLRGQQTTCWALGDLVFLVYPGGAHVAIYVGNGLFMDCYNPDTGCILHDVATDSFYQQHYAGARRIVAGCGPVTSNLGAADTPAYQPDPGAQYPTPPVYTFAQVPDLVYHVSFVVPQCRDEDNQTYTEREPQPDGAWDAFYPFRWLAWQVGNLFESGRCWGLAIGQHLANVGAGAVNVALDGLNLIWRYGVVMWTNARAAFFGFWAGIESLRTEAWAIEALLAAGAAAVGQTATAALELVGSLGGILGNVLLGLVGIFGWVGGLAGGLVGGILGSVRGDVASAATPALLATSSPIYCAVQGTAEGLRAALPWAFALLYGLIYIAFVFWFSRYLSVTPQ